MVTAYLLPPQTRGSGVSSNAADGQKQAPLVSNRGTAAVGAWSQHTSKDKDAGWSGMSCNADGGQGQAPSVSNRGTAAVDAFVIGSKV